MPDWIQMDMEDFDTTRKATIKGVEVELFVSPYDVPEAVRGRYDSDKRKFIIDFKYVGDEATTTAEFEHVTYTVGESSARLYGLMIDVDTLEVGSVGVSVEFHDKDGQELAARIINKVTGAIDNLIRRHPIAKSKEREDNYQMAKRAILAKQEEIQKDLLPKAA
jgi:hypothetical protein